MTSQPMLWRVPAYCEPGFPRPTTSFKIPPRTARCGPKPVRGRRAASPGHGREGRSGMVPGRANERRSGWDGGEQPALQRPHGGFFLGFCMVPPADVEGAVRHEEPQLVGRGPANVAGVAASAGLGLLDRPLHGDDDVPEVRTAAWWEDEHWDG